MRKGFIKGNIIWIVMEKVGLGTVVRREKESFDDEEV